MKILMALMLLTLTSTAMANHCNKPEFVPKDVRLFALSEIVKVCPNTIDQDKMNIVFWDHESWDTEEYFTIHFKGLADSAGDLDYDIIIKVDTECYGPSPRLLSVDYLDIKEGCY